MECYGLIIGILFLESYALVRERLRWDSEWVVLLPITIGATAKYLCILSLAGTKIDVQHVRFFSLINKRRNWGFHNNIVRLQLGTEIKRALNPKKCWTHGLSNNNGSLYWRSADLWLIVLDFCTVSHFQVSSPSKTLSRKRTEIDHLT